MNSDRKTQLSELYRWNNKQAAALAKEPFRFVRPTARACAAALVTQK
jgi:hypothetical protein